MTSPVPATATSSLRALRLLKRFFQLGPWAVNLALSVGIFPYVLKLLQSPAADLRQVMHRRRDDREVYAVLVPKDGPRPQYAHAGRVPARARAERWPAT